jgi:DNA-binding transcriptional regulator YdaS (Cro superfamily)
MSQSVAPEQKSGNENSPKLSIDGPLRTVLYFSAMTIIEFLQHSGMTQAELARRMDVFESQLSRWVNGHQQIAWHHAVKLEGITDGLCTCEELRPDLEYEWKILRRRSEAA